MAEKVVKDLGEDFLNCCICMGSFKTPKMLPCIHSFCEGCLEKYAVKQGSNEIPCPTCRKICKLPDTGVKGLQTNFHLVNLAERVVLLEKLTSPQKKEAAMCDSCKNPEIVAYCVDCSFVICAKCQNHHSLFPLLQTHSVIPLSQISDPEFQQKWKHARSPYCQLHSSEKLHFYCETCSQLICRDCTIVLHAKHAFVEASSKFPDIKDNLCKLLESSKYQLRSCSTMAEERQEEYDLMNKERKRVERVLDAACRKNVLEIKGKYNDLKKQMLAEIAQRETPFENVKALIKRLQNINEITQTVIEENNPWELLGLFADLTAAFAELKTDSESIDLGPQMIQHDIMFAPSSVPEIQLGIWYCHPADAVATDGAGNFFLCKFTKSSKLLSVVKTSSDNNELDIICSYNWTDNLPEPFHLAVTASDSHLFVAIGNVVVKIDHGTEQFVSKAALGELGLIHCITYNTVGVIPWIFITGSGTSRVYMCDCDLGNGSAKDLLKADAVTSLCSVDYEFVYCSNDGIIRHYNWIANTRKKIRMPPPHNQQTKATALRILALERNKTDGQYTIFVLQQVTGDEPKVTPGSDSWVVQEYAMSLKKVVGLLDCSEVGMTKPPESLFTVTAEDRSVTLHLCDRFGQVTTCKREAYKQDVLEYQRV